MKLQTAFVALASIGFLFADEPPKRPPGGSSRESEAMVKLLESFHLTAEQRAAYDAARAETGKKMREIHEGKVSGQLPQEEVLKQALAVHKAFNSRVKEILIAEQYALWEPQREADHHKIAQAHKVRDEAAKPVGPK